VPLVVCVACVVIFARDNDASRDRDLEQIIRITNDRKTAEIAGGRRFIQRALNARKSKPSNIVISK
jgi:hypothetical protein